ncbi:DUF4376 domain-containing protein [Aureimonas flava]|uniref:DUF4376 domain-containing protein n=1 Tax=Aureimonas flava TaxID=2320271 RepID=A0A3A1WR20_9HYPH|nr:DUF4376 domain-containing protein [Aureimonas flava]RIY00228.1 DUF4376 domain-containing protein [Aureimonas flava]
MTDLYRRNRGAPAALPPVAYDLDNNAYTAPYGTADLAMLGFVKAPKKPDDTDTQTAAWDASAEKWVMVDRPPVLEPSPPTADEVEAEKVRRIEIGFPFMGKTIQSRQEDRENIAGAKSAAQDAKLLGAEPGELSWQKRLDTDKGAEIFAWITADNSLLQLDADAMIAMGYAAMLHKQRLIFVAKGIKDRVAAGERIADVTADALWE